MPNALNGITTGLNALRSRICRADGGNVSIIFGLSVVSLFGIVGGGVDMARMFAAKYKVQAALDSAALAGGRALQLSPTGDVGVAIATAESYFREMTSNGVSEGAATFTVIESGTVLKGQVNFSLGTPFLAVVGLPRLHAQLSTEAALASGGNAGTSLEVSLMLDTTGSMSGQKIEDMKAAAKDLVDIVVWADQGTYSSKVALAPFSARVNVGSAYISALTGMSATWSGRILKPCVTDRTGVEAFTDAPPGPNAWLNAYGGDRDSDTTNYSYAGACTNPQEAIMPLTSDKAALKAHIDTFDPDGSTAGALGTAWAWYLLSPKWNSIWPEASRPRPYGDLTTIGSMGVPVLKKVAVLMTDGIYNTTGSVNYGDTSSQAQTISDNAVTLCTNMKAEGITVYTVGFELGSNQMAIDTLKACASREDGDPQDQPSYFFNTANGEELKAAFRQIALQLAKLRLRS
jgi:Flp pilus assembly protein TadG